MPTLPPLVLGGVSYPAQLPPLARRIAWRGMQQELAPVDAPLAAFVGAGLCCPSLPQPDPGEELPAYGERLLAWLEKKHSDLGDIDLYNPCDDVTAAMMKAMYPSPKAVVAAKNSSEGAAEPPIAPSSTPAPPSTETPSPSTE